MLNRRNFLRTSALAASSAFVPNFLKGFENSALNLGRKKTNQKILVVVQLSGGNDGLNTIIPYRNDDYYRLRPSLSIERGELFKLTDEIGLNTSMEAFAELYDQGLVSILNSVGYPNPNRSHFRSMDIWQTGSAANQYLNTGWLGRYLDAQCTGSDCAMHTGIEVDGGLSLAMKGEEVKGIAVTRPHQLHKITSNSFYQEVAQQGTTRLQNHEEPSNVSYLYKTMIETASSAEYIHQKSKVHKSKGKYPMHQFGRHLKTIAELIAADIDTSVFYVSLSGFDTHVRQKNVQARLLKTYAEGMNAFVGDLQQYNKMDEVLIMTFSEFGRRVKQNASGGTDHGAANNLFLIGNHLQKAGIYNAPPNLLDLDKGDLKHQIDFRQVYTSVLDSWLGVDASAILGERFSGIELF